MPEKPIPEVLPGRTILWKGREYLYFSGTGYLGMHADEDFRTLVREGLDQFGGHFGGSRLSQVQPSIFETAEKWLADWANAESAIVLSSGTLAGQIMARFLADTHHCLYAPGVHPALWGSMLPAQIGWGEWVSGILHLMTHNKEPLAIFANAVDPLKACPVDFDWIAKIPPDNPVTLVLDDSHGFGITGTDGGGIYRILQCPPHVSLVVIASLGKAPGIPAGVILGNRQLLDEIRESPLYGGASPPTPAFLYALCHSQEIYRRNLERLRSRIRQFIRELPTRWPLQFMEDYPVFYTPDESAAGQLEDKGIIISSFSYPRPGDNRISRIILNAQHTESDIQKLLQACKG